MGALFLCRSARTATNGRRVHRYRCVAAARAARPHLPQNLVIKNDAASTVERTRISSNAIYYLLGSYHTTAVLHAESGGDGLSLCRDSTGVYTRVLHPIVECQGR